MQMTVTQLAKLDVGAFVPKIAYCEYRLPDFSLLALLHSFLLNFQRCCTVHSARKPIEYALTKVCFIFEIYLDSILKFAYDSFDY